MKDDFYMNSNDMINCLTVLNEKLKIRNINGQINLVGGAVMCLALRARELTHDIDAIFEPKSILYSCIAETANELNIPKDWLNDSVKGFLSNKAEFIPFERLSNLSIYVASPQYMLAMKCMSARMDNMNEIEDIKFIIKYLNISTYEQVEGITSKYYPPERIMVKTKYLIMEVLQGTI